jgi:hypothetical protein
MAGLEGMLFEDSGQTVEPRSPESYMMLAGAAVRETLVSNPVASIFRSAELGLAQEERVRLSADEARSRIKSEGFDGALLVPDAGISKAALDILIERKQDERLRQEIFDNAPTGVGATSLKLAMGFAGSLIDPINVASGFIPVVGQARYARLLGKAPGALRRTSVRAGIGAVEGTAGAALVEPLIAGAKSYEQADYDMADSLLNIGFGGLFGAGLHVSGGALGDAWRYARGSAGDIAARVAPETREAGLRAAIGQLVRGERVDVEPLMRMDPSARVPDVTARAESVASRTEEDSAGYDVAEGELTDEQLAAFQGLRSELPAEEKLGGSGEGVSRESGDQNDGRARGEPLSVYRGASRELSADDFDPAALGHATGHPSSGLGVFFTNTRQNAAQYGAVSEHVLDIRNPKRVNVEDLRGFDSLDDAHAFRQELERQGFDGMVIDASHLGGPVNYVAFKHEQVLRRPAAERPTNVDPRALDAVRAAAEAPKLSTVADERASEHADQALTESEQLLARTEQPTEDDVALIDEEAAAILADLKAQGVEADMAAADELAANAETYSNAARAAVVCGLRHA